VRLEAPDGVGNKTIAGRHGVTAVTVRDWRATFTEEVDQLWQGQARSGTQTDVRVREPCRGLAEVHRPRVGDGQFIGEHDRLTVDVVCQHRDRTVGGVDGNQSQVGVSHHQPPVRVNLDSQGIASGGDHVDGLSCRVDPHRPAPPT